MSATKCRSCGAIRSVARYSISDLSRWRTSTPLRNTNAIKRSDSPLKICLCEQCWLLQLEQTVPPSRLFSDYAYFSSYSDTWMGHAKRFAQDTRERWHLDGRSLVVEVASNDGYLLRHFVELGIPVLGIDPAENVVPTALAAGVPTEVGFFGTELAERLAGRGWQPISSSPTTSLPTRRRRTISPAGLARVLAPEGILSIEFPELTTMLTGAQFDQIYHEHVFYFSLLSCERILRRNGLRVIGAEQLSTHGGSLRVTACLEAASHTPDESVGEQRAEERRLGLAVPDVYEAFAAAADRRASSVRAFLEDAAARGRSVAGYGAAAKGNTLLNYCGVSTARSATWSIAVPTSRATSCLAPICRSSRSSGCWKIAPTTWSSSLGTCWKRCRPRSPKSASGEVRS